MLNQKSHKNLTDLTTEALEAVASYMDTESCLNLLRSCKTIRVKLNGTQKFWKHLCVNENFHKYSVLR